MPLQADFEADFSPRRQGYRKVRIMYGNAFDRLLHGRRSIASHRARVRALQSVVRHFPKPMLGQGSGLQQHLAGVHPTQVHQVHHEAISLHGLDERGHIRWQARAFALGVKVAQRGHQDAAVVQELRRAQG